MSDSFKYNRVNDLGYLIGRVFINKDKHFFTDGNGRMSFLHNDFQNDTLNKDTLKNIVQELMLHAMDFELITPPYKDVQVVSLHQIKEMSQNMKLKTANYDIKYHLPTIGKFETIVGVQGMHQINTNYGEETLIPNAKNIWRPD